MAYYDTLSNEQKDNINILIDESKKAGITNPYAQAGLLSIISKESSFVPKQEKSYSGTSNARIRKVFACRVGDYSEAELTKLKADPKAFFDVVYGGRYDNAPDEGYKYRGRGFNQITFKSAYKKYGDKAGVNLVNNPDALLEPKPAAKVAVAFAKYRIGRLKDKNMLSEYNAKDINDFKNERDAVQAFYHANTGTGKSVAEVKAKEHSTTLGGMKRALDRVGSLYDYTKSVVGEAVKGGVDYIKKNKIKTVIITSLLLVSGYVLLRTLKT